MGDELFVHHIELGESQDGVDQHISIQYQYPEDFGENVVNVRAMNLRVSDDFSVNAFNEIKQIVADLVTRYSGMPYNERRELELTINDSDDSRPWDDD